MAIQPLPVNLDAEDEATLAEYDEGFFLLSQYAHKKRLAIDARKKGRIDIAKILEHQLDVLYKQLPAWKGW